VTEDIDITALVHDLSSLLQSATSKKAIPKFELSDGLPALDADPTQMRQIILNVVTNASEAIICDPIEQVWPGRVPGAARRKGSSQLSQEAFRCLFSERTAEDDLGERLADGESRTRS